jgi:hypothetical protein
MAFRLDINRGGTLIDRVFTSGSGGMESDAADRLPALPLRE